MEATGSRAELMVMTTGEESKQAETEMANAANVGTASRDINDFGVDSDDDYSDHASLLEAEEDLEETENEDDNEEGDEDGDDDDHDDDHDDDGDEADEDEET